jgi:hypothetical protein
MLELHRSVIEAARADVGADWAALVDGDGRILMARPPAGASLAPTRPAVWRSHDEHLALVTADDGTTLAVGRRRSPFELDERRRLGALAAQARCRNGMMRSTR